MPRQLAWIVVVCLGACTAVDSPVVQSNATPAAAPTGRLPANVVPLSYRLDLTIVPQRETFDGHVEITVNIGERLNRFFLHATGLEVSQALLRLADGDVIEADFRETEAEGVAEIVLPRFVAPQTAQLEIGYRGAFGQRLKGLYRVRDGDEDYAFTQFEPISAREAFPGFDEPAFKTPFDIVLNVANGHTAITTTPEVERLALENGMVRVRYATTPPLPTYLIAFAVGPLDVVPAPPVPATRQRATPLPLRGIAAAGKGERLGHALGTTPELLRLLEAYFDIAHPYPKLDIIAVPDFGSGAMENAGAITYRESLLLLADDAPVSQRRRHALVHAHELAHQWFGNLVTMPWWDDIWLNESFATWMAYKTVARWNPDYGANQSRVRSIANAMREDSLSTARQVRQPVLSNHDIENAFDSITYAKGGAVLSMFERYLGKAQFREAMRRHVRRFANGNADANDFIASLADVGGERVGDALRSFLFQPGIPLVEVALDCSGNPAVTLRQSRYRPIGSDAPDGEWTIPVCLRYGDDSERHENCELVGPGEHTIELDTDTCPDWLLPNAGFAGYYHWVLPAGDYPNLIAAGDKLTVAEELSIADSVTSGLASGRFSVGEAGALLAALAHSPRPAVALTPRGFIEQAREHLISRPGPAFDGLVRYTRELYAELPSAGVFDPEFMAAQPDDARRLFLTNVAELMAWAGDTAVRQAATDRAGDWIDGDTGRLAPDSVELALGLAVEDGGTAVIDQLLERLAASSDGHERRTLLRALARVTAPADAERLRNLALSKMIRTNEIRRFIRDHVNVAANREATWEWLQTRFEALVTRLPPRDAGRLPADIAAGLCDEEAADAAEAYLRPRMEKLVGGPRNLAKAIETIRLCARRAAVQRAEAEAYF